MLVSRGRILSEKRIILRQIDYNTLLSIPKGYGGRIGVLPLLPDGRYLLNRSNRGLWSDFGGGVKAREYHMEALERELEEEAKVWKDRLLDRIPNGSIYCLEEYYPRDERRNRRTIRIQILCIVPFDEEWLEEFTPSDEVLSIHLVSDLNPILETDELNLGLRQLKQVLDDSHQ